MSEAIAVLGGFTLGSIVFWVGYWLGKSDPSPRKEGEVVHVADYFSAGGESFWHDASGKVTMQFKVIGREGRDKLRVIWVVKP